MAKKAAIPQDNKEWPDYEYRAFPKWIGRDEFGQDLIANTQEDVEALVARKEYPRVLGLDRNGNEVAALHPDEVSIKKSQVTRPADQVAEKRQPDPALLDENARLRKELEELRAKPEPKKSRDDKKAA